MERDIISNNVRLNEKLSPPPVKKSLRVREVSASNLLWPANPGWLPVKAGLMDVRVVACRPPLVVCQIFDLLEVS